MNSYTVTITEDQVPEFVKEFLALLLQKNDGAQVIALRGDLGAGKTTFVKALGAALGVIEHITSPTFTILKQYETTDDIWKQLLHMDAYRIEDITELGPLGFSTLLTSPETLFCIEWAENIVEALPTDCIELVFENTSDEKTRTIHVGSR